jgi:hypothetical protein
LARRIEPNQRAHFPQVLGTKWRSRPQAGRQGLFNRFKNFDCSGYGTIGKNIDWLRSKRPNRFKNLNFGGFKQRNAISDRYDSAGCLRFKILNCRRWIALPATTRQTEIGRQKRFQQIDIEWKKWISGFWGQSVKKMAKNLH